MTTDQLRKEIIVSHWTLHSAGITIGYYINTKHDPQWLKLNPEECARQLSAISSIDSWESHGSMFSGLLLNIGTQSMNWNAFVNEFKLSQWEALTLAIRHEYELSIEQDSNMMNITNAVNKLNQNG